MKLSVTTFFLILGILAAPAAAGTLSLDVSGVLGPDLQGSDPLKVSGIPFTATGAINPNAPPIFTTGDSATYELSGDIDIMLGQLALTGYDAMLTITVPPSGPDAVVVDFTVDELGYKPEVAASFSLPTGTLNGTEIQKFWAEVTEPAGILAFGIPDDEDTISGTVGITGSVSIGGVPPPSVPEPGTLSLLGCGLALAIAGKMRVSRK
jgi:hypothetical protein